MKYFNIGLSDEAAAGLETKASALGIDTRTYASIILDNLFAGVTPAQFQLAAIGRPKRGKPAPALNVAEAFSGYPPLSIEIAQSFVDEALKLPNVKVHQYKRSIVFTPAFVFVDYPLSTRAKERGGIVASFYGKPGDFDDPRGMLHPSRRSYLRTRIVTHDDLSYCLPFIRRAYERRFGQLPK